METFSHDLRVLFTCPPTMLIGSGSHGVWEGWVHTADPSTWSPWPLLGRRGMQMCSARPCCRAFFQHLVAPGVFGVCALRAVCLQMFCCVLPLGMGHRREQSQGPRSCLDHKLEQPLEGAGPWKAPSLPLSPRASHEHIRRSPLSSSRICIGRGSICKWHLLV